MAWLFTSTPAKARWYSSNGPFVAEGDVFFSLKTRASRRPAEHLPRGPRGVFMRATLATRHVTHARVTGNAPGHGRARQLRESLDVHPQSDVSTAQSVAHVANATYAVAIPAGAKCCCQPEAPPQPMGGDVAGVAESSGQSLLQRNISGNRVPSPVFPPRRIGETQ